MFSTTLTALIASGVPASPPFFACKRASIQMHGEFHVLLMFMAELVKLASGQTKERICSILAKVIFPWMYGSMNAGKNDNSPAIMSTENWDTTFTVARLLGEQLPKLLEVARSEDLAAAGDGEDIQAESLSAYLTHMANSAVLVLDEPLQVT